MALDWNEIIITNDDEVVNGKVRDRMILVTGEKGEDGTDGRGIVSVRRTGRSGNLYYFTIDYTDGTKSVFEIDVPQGGGGSDINTLVFAEDFNPNRHYDVGDYVWYNSDLWRFEQEHQAETPWNPNLADEKTITYEFVDYLHLEADYAKKYVIAEEFDKTEEYRYGTYVLHEGRLYRFRTSYIPSLDHEWDSRKVEEVNITDEFINSDQFEEGLSDYTPKNIVAQEFDKDTAYNVGDYVIHDNKLYIFASNHIAGAIWDSNLVIEKNITEQFIDYYKLNDRLEDYAKTDVIAEEFDAQESYAVGDYVYFQGKMYRFIQPHVGTAWNSAHVVEVTVGGELLPDAPSDSKTYGRKNGAWSELDTLVDWGEISGDIEDQTDLIDKINEVVTYYVNDGTGSDSNDGSAEHPFATLAKAISLIPDYRQGTIYAISACNDTDLEIENKNINFILSNDGMIIVASGGTNLIKNSKVTFSGSGTVIINDALEVEESDVLFDENAELRVITNQLDTGGITANHSHLIIAGDLTVTMPTTLGAKTICVSALSGSFVAISNQDSYLTAQWAFKSSASVIMVDDTLRSAHWNCAVNFVTEKGGRVYVGTAPEFGDMAFVNNPSAGGVYGRVNGAWSLLTDTFYTESEVDDIADEKQDIIIKTASGSMAEFTTDLSAELAKCIVNIDPVQETGGYDVGMKNILPPFTSTTEGNATLVVDEYGKCIFNKTGSDTVSFSQPNTLTLNAGTYTLSMHNPKISNGSLSVWLSKYADRTIPGITGASCSTVYVNNHVTFTLSETTTVYVHFTSRYGFTNFEFSPMLEVGSTSSDYQPYQHICPISGWTGCNVIVSPTTDAQDGTTYSISFGSAGTVYKATLDVLTGVLTVTHGQIASYSGQTLTGEWISDRDEYAVGTTPTTGAQVVYELAEPVIYHLTPVQVMSLIGENHVWANTGDVEIGYFRSAGEELVEYISDKLSLKQDTLTFDDVPTANSTNPVKSGGVKTALDTKQDVLTFDTVPTENSTNPVTSNGIKTALDDKSDPVTKSASGSIVTLTDATDAPVSDMVVAIEPIQAGTGDPSPDNVRAISGWDTCNVYSTGKNLLNIQNYNRLQSPTIINNDTIQITESYKFAEYYLSLKPATYTMSYKASGLSTGITSVMQAVPEDGTAFDIRANRNGSDGAIANTFTVTDQKIIRIRLYLATTSETPVTISNIQLELGSSATTYEPYNGQTVTIDLDGTRYGGRLNVTTGKLTLTQCGFTADGVKYYATGGGTAGGKRYFGFLLSTFNLPKTFTTTDANKDKYLCNVAVSGPSASFYNYFYGINQGVSIYYYPNEDMQSYTVADFNTYLQTNSVQFVYPLAEPITIQLSSTEVRTLTGLNNIWSDTGDILSLDYMTSDATALVQYIKNQDDNNVITKSAESGSIAHFYNSAEAPLAGLKIGIEPVQAGSGDPSPSNIRPITGFDVCNVTRTGKNLVNIKMNEGTLAGINFTKNSDNSITCTGTSTSGASTKPIIQYEHLVPNTYIVSGATTTMKFRIYIFDRNKVEIRRISSINQPTEITLAEGEYYLYVSILTPAANTVVNETIYPMVRLASDLDDTYEPFGQIVTIDLGGTRYGGMLDVPTGVLTVDKVSVDLGTLNWSFNTDYHIGYVAFPGKKPGRTNFMASSYKVVDKHYNAMLNGEASGVLQNQPSNTSINIKDDRFSTATDFKNGVSGQTIVYELATPITIQLDPANLRTLANENFVWTDTGDILSLDYYTPTGKTTAEAIDAVKTDAIYDTTQTRGMITQSSESSMTASKNYVTGDLLIIGNQLLRAKFNISSGTTITIGTSGNTEVVDLATVISELSARVSALES